jgi:hypothetical protein
MYNCSEAFSKTIKNSNCSVKAVCFGYGSSFLVSYGFDHGHLGWTHDLQGFYPSLNRFLNSQKKSGNKISIHVSYKWQKSSIHGTDIGVGCDT